MLVANHIIKVMSFKLISGEEIIGEVTEITNTQVVVKNPVTVSMVPMETGQMQINLIPVMVSVPRATTIPFYKSAIVCDPIPVRPEAEAQYKKVTSA